MPKYFKQKCPYCDTTLLSQKKSEKEIDMSYHLLSLCDVVKCVKSGQKINAIKIVREKKNLGLREAKELVDTI